MIQQLTIQLRGGQTLSVGFQPGSDGGINEQINFFCQKLTEKDPGNDFFMFQGQTTILVRFADVSGVQIVNIDPDQNSLEPVKPVTPAQPAAPTEPAAPAAAAPGGQA